MPARPAQDCGYVDEYFNGAVPDPEVVADAWDTWRAEVAFADQYVAEAPDLDLLGMSTTQATLPVLVDLWAPWCAPCRAVSPVLESLAQQFAGRVKVVKVNVVESPALAQRFEARGIPMLLVLRAGAIVAEQVGAAPEQVLRPWLEKALEDASTRNPA
jgi:thioredoxin 2